jgi:AraC-like DNA-binding protein
MDQRLDGSASSGAREHVLPTGSMHLVFRLTDEPLRLFDDAENARARVIGRAVVGGARSSYYVRDISAPSCSVGAMLRPGAARALFGATAEELSERHTPLEDLWGAGARLAEEQLREVADLELRLAELEHLLCARLPTVRGVHPAVAHALERFERHEPVASVVRETGYSHRHFIALFRGAVGLAPKEYSRVIRFRSVLLRASAEPATPWTTIALDAGYSDQAHFSRDFVRFAGMAPGLYRRSAPAFPHHVSVHSDPALRARSIPFKT